MFLSEIRHAFLAFVQIDQSGLEPRRGEGPECERLEFCLESIVSETPDRLQRIAIAVTTIGDGAFLDGFRRQAEAEGLREQVHFFVIPDRKTPPQLAERCQALAAEGYQVSCPTLPEQEAYLARLGAPHGEFGGEVVAVVTAPDQLSGQELHILQCF